MSTLLENGGPSSSTATATATATNGDSIIVTKPKTLSDLATPAFVVNRHAFAKNCQSVLDMAQQRSFKLRPHIKTHKTLQGVQLQAAGSGTAYSDLITGFVASTLPEVELLVQHAIGSSNSSTNAGSILFGVPISAAKLQALYALQQKLILHKKTQTDTAAKEPEAKRPKLQQQQSDRGNGTNGASAEYCKIHILMDHPQQIQMVQDFLATTRSTNSDPTAFQVWSVFVKLDTGYHRAGTTCDEQGIALIDQIVQSPHLELAGLYSHCGHAYDSNDPVTLDNIAQTDMDSIQQFIQRLENHPCQTVNHVFDHQPYFTLSVGSTPSLWHHWNPASAKDNHFSEQQQWWSAFLQRHPTTVLEIHPGNYTFYDRQQLFSGAAATGNGKESSSSSSCCVAARVLTRVIGHYNDFHRPQTILMDAGATALTKETTPQGGMAAIAGAHEEDMEVYKMSQEVTMARPKMMEGNNNAAAIGNVLETFPLGSLVTLLPNHSCLAAACFDKYYVIDDPSCEFDPTTPIVDEWVPVKGW